MEDNIQDKKEENQNEEQENNYDEENGEEEVGEEEANLNYNGEYEGDLEGEEEVQEENNEEAQNYIEGEENQENENKEEQQVEEYQQMNNQNEEFQNENINDNGEEEKDINNNINNNNEINNKEENKIENLSINNINNINNTNEKNNLNNKFEISTEKDNNNNTNTKKLSNMQRIELINNKLNLNLNKIQNKAKTKKENKVENEIDNEQYEFNTLNVNRRKNDILSEVLNKIQDFKQRKDNFNDTRDRYNSNQILDNLDKEITKGLDKLNNKRIIIEDKNIDISETNKVEKKILKNPKFKEIVTMINDKEGRKYKRNYNLAKNDLLNFVNNKKHNDIFGNINLYTQKRNNNNIFNSFQNNPVKKIGSDSNKFYISCIDGKAIVNGMRKDIPIVSKFNNINYRLNNYNNMFDDYKKINLTMDNLNITRKRNDNFNFKNDFTFKEGKNNRKFNLNLEKDGININNTLKSNFMNENWNKDNNYFKGGLKYFK